MFEVLLPFSLPGMGAEVNCALIPFLSQRRSLGRELYLCLIPSKSTTLVSVAPNASGLAPQTFWKWFLGMAAKPHKSPLHLAQKTVWVASAVKLLVLPTS
jgi:hypothetical protein